jgi:hypothetical protein
VQIDHAFKQVVDRRQHVGQWPPMRLLDDIGSSSRHAERLLGFAVGDVTAPGACLAVEVFESRASPMRGLA